MLETNNWLTPTYNGNNRYDKPILFYWLVIIAYKIFGINEFSARLPSALSAILLTIVIFLFVKKNIDERHAIFSLIPWILCPYFIIYSHAAVTDMVLCLFISLSLFSFFISTNDYINEKKKNNFYIYSFYLFSALATLTKGLIGILIPFGVSIIYMLLTCGRKCLKNIFNIRGIILFLLICLPWFLIQIYINGSEFINLFFIKHHFKRYTGVISGHKGPIYYFIPVLILGLFPWSSYIPSSIKRIAIEKEKIQIFLLTWFLFIFIFFSFSTTKLPNYILPSIPALCILISYGINFNNERWQNTSLIILTVLSITLATILFIGKDYGIYYNSLNVKPLWFLLVTLSLIAITAIYQLLTKKRKPFITCLLTGLFLYIIMSEVFPLINHHLQDSIYRYSLYAKEKLNKDDYLITLSLNNPSIVFYSNHKIIPLRNKEELKNFIQKNKYTIIITKARHIGYLTSSGFSLIESDNKYAILEKK